jgi:Family of unknown function (DUF6049)
MRRAGASLVLAVLLLGVAQPGPAAAQDEPPVRLTLVKQSAYATPDRPLAFQVSATNNTGEAIPDLALKLWVYPSARSRSEYDEALRFDEVSPLHVSTFAVEGALEAGQTRKLPAIEARLPILEDLGENALYPVKVELTSQNFTVAEMRSVTVYIQERIVLPLDVSITFVLDAPPSFRPDGTFTDDTLLRRIAPEGRIGAVVDALADTPVASTLAISPLLLEQLRRMGDGFSLLQDDRVVSFGPNSPQARRAAAVLDQLRAVARAPAEVVALPYASPSLPAMASAGLREALRAQVNRGRQLVETVLGVPTVDGAFRPPGGTVDDASMDLLIGLGERDLILDAEAVSQPTFFFTPSPVAALETEGGRGVNAVYPDAGVDRRFDDGDEDPRLAAMQTLGEMSAIYFERPGTARGVAVVIGEDDAPRPGFLRTLLRSMASQREGLRWLRPVTATRLLLGERQPVPRRLRPLPTEAFSPLYVSELSLARDDLAQFAAVAGIDHEVVNRLGTLVLTSQSRFLIPREEEAVAMLDAVERDVGSELGKINPPRPTTIRLTSRSGVIPLTIGNEADYPMDVRVVLRAPGLTFLGGSSRLVKLTRPEQQLTFPVRAERTGRFPVVVEVQTPRGAEIAESRILVRSTAYNRVALVVTIGAALFLALWWSRRFLPRARR